MNNDEFNDLLQNANKGNIVAIMAVAKCYKNGDGCIQDTQKSIEYYEKAANLENVQAMLVLVRHFQKLNPQRAFEWSKKAADTGDHTAIQSLAYSYDCGIGCAVDRRKAIKLYKQLAIGGSWIDMYNLAVCYRKGNPSGSDLKHAFTWYRRAAKENFVSAMNNLGSCYQEGKGCHANPDKAFMWYTKAASRAFPPAIHNLALCYHYGIGCTVNKLEAFKLYEQNSNKSIDSMLSLAYCYFSGCGTEVNFEKAFELFFSAAASKDPKAMNNLAHCYQNGLGCKVNQQRAFELLTAAAVSEAAEPCFNLALCYYYGTGCIQNPEQAFIYFTKAAEKLPLARLYVAYCYGNGIGTKANRQQSFMWYLSAAKLGVSKAIPELANGCKSNARFSGEVFNWLQDTSSSVLKFVDLNLLHVIMRQNDNRWQWVKDRQKYFEGTVSYFMHEIAGFGDNLSWITAMKAYAKFSSLIFEILDRQKCISDNSCHFTSLSVLRNMLPWNNRNDSLPRNVLRMYNAQYMNDPNEGMELLNKNRGVHNTLLNELYSSTTPEESFANFIVSFSKAEDSLTLWRLYGRDGKGVCLVLPFDYFDGSVHREFKCVPCDKQLLIFDEVDGNEDKGEARLKIDTIKEHRDKHVYSVIYDDNIIHDDIIRLENELKVFWDAMPKALDDDTRSILNKLLRFCIDEIRFLYKNKHYSTEEERRMIGVYPISSEYVNMDDSEETPRFYVTSSVPIFKKPGTKIILGPKVNQLQATILEVNLRIQRNGLNGNVEVKKTDVQYR